MILTSISASAAFLSAPALSPVLGSRAGFSSHPTPACGTGSTGASLRLGVKAIGGQRGGKRDGPTILCAAGEHDLLVIGAGVLVMCCFQLEERRNLRNMYFCTGVKAMCCIGK